MVGDILVKTVMATCLALSSIESCILCPKGFTRRDDNSCDCYDPCKNVHCEFGLRCEVKQELVCDMNDLYRDIGFLLYHNYEEMQWCIMKYTNRTKCVPIICPTSQCPRCRYDYGISRNMGCLVSGCTCNDPCKEVGCPSGYRCIAIPVPCIRPPCPVEPTCVSIKCPYRFNCRACPSGQTYRKDDTGCRTCECYDPCEGVTCDRGQICVVGLSECSSVTCDPEPRCQYLTCPANSHDMCTGEFQTHIENGCYLNHCYDPCEGVQCPYMSRCSPRRRWCLQPPCVAEPVCVKETLSRDPYICFGQRNYIVYLPDGSEGCLYVDPCTRVACPNGTLCILMTDEELPSEEDFSRPHVYPQCVPVSQIDDYIHCDGDMVWTSCGPSCTNKAIEEVLGYCGILDYEHPEDPSWYSGNCYYICHPRCWCPNHKPFLYDGNRCASCPRPSVVQTTTDLPTTTHT